MSYRFFLRRFGQQSRQFMEKGFSSKYYLIPKKFVEKGFSSKYLLLTNTLTCGVLLAAGDFIQQKIEKSQGKADSFDFPRHGRMFAVGLTQGPTQQVWYTFLDKHLPQRTPKTVGLKILGDQTVAAPFFAITFFFGMGILEGKDLKDCWKEFSEKFWTVYMCDWCFWPLAQSVNFAFVAPQFRVLYVSVMTVLWNIFLSYIKHFDELEVQKQADPLAE